jgi:hypothetical protein
MSGYRASTPVAPGGEDTYNPFAIAQSQLDEAAEILQLDPSIHALLREPLRELHVSLPIRMDDGGFANPPLQKHDGVTQFKSQGDYPLTTGNETMYAGRLEIILMDSPFE